jgi:hypothetical protein
MWLMDHLMNMEASDVLGGYFVRLPLSEEAAIVEANALAADWADVASGVDYVFGNPPFIGSKMMSDEQRGDLLRVFTGSDGSQPKGAGVLDYVAAWYYKAARYMAGTRTRAAFVSTNSITQGEQAALLWRPLIQDHGMHIDFAWRTFRWTSEARGRAAVHCVIVGFSAVDGIEKVIHDGEASVKATNINPYLVGAPDVFLSSRQRSLCDVPPIGIGNKPIDDGNYLFTDDEKVEFLKKEPAAAKWFRPWIGADEFINGHTRHCLWLGECPPSELRRMPEAMKRVEAVRQFRLKSKSAPTRKLASTPCRFHVENMPETTYIAIPETSFDTKLQSFGS